MVEVFYRGYGCWAWKRSYPETDPISPEYVASGVFTLFEHDANAYKYTKEIDKHIICLLPSTAHPDSEFLRLAAYNPDVKYTAEECYFRINVEENKNKDRILRIVDTQNDQLKTKTVKPPPPQDRVIPLKLPKRADDWALAINEMYMEYCAEIGSIPNQTQAWVRLNEVPPNGYGIGQGVDRGEVCLTMPGVKPLSRSAFNKRWNDYTSENSGE